MTVDSSGKRAPASERLHSILQHLPEAPGVYLMKNRRGEIFYVGKAIDLRSRVRSYFRASGDGRAFVQLLDQILEDIELVVVRDEREALLLENALIKQHRPRYNVRLRDDKNFLSLRIDLRGLEATRRGQAAARSDLYPRVTVTRRPHKDGARYFGPYTSAAQARETLRLLNRHFGLRTCSDRTFASRRRPCILYQMHRCPGPCVLEVPHDNYQRQVDDVMLLLGGAPDELVASLRGRMQEASTHLEFETAARLRDQLQAVEAALAVHAAPGGRLIDRDAFGLVRDGPLLALAVVPQRRNVLGAPRLHLFQDQVAPDAELLSSVLVQFYGDQDDAALPDEILVPWEPQDAAALRAWLRERGGRQGGRRTPQLKVPRRGDARQLVEVATTNARRALDDKLRQETQRLGALEALARRLRLPSIPRRIECFDVSTLQGQSAVASRVRFVDGEPDPSGYRRYAIRTVEGQDDFAMLHEALVRRLRRGLREDDLPDLLIVDGGKGQLAVAQAACRDLGMQDLWLASIAKSRLAPATQRGDDVAVRSDERVFVIGRKEAIALPPHSVECALVSRIRDEAHRFAITYHRTKRSRRSLGSALDQIPGLGPVLRRRLLRHFGSVRRLRDAEVTAVAEVQGVGAALAARVVAQLRSTVRMQDLSSGTESEAATGTRAADAPARDKAP
ncbi:MAG: excinuclease ABC subunit UvrC [Pseudomonadota bacterium]